MTEHPIIQKIEKTRVEYAEQGKSIENLVYVVSPTEYQELCEWAGVDPFNNTMFTWKGVSMSVEK